MPRRLEHVLLTIAAGDVVLPRRVRLTLSPGRGALRVAPSPPVDPTWRASVEQAWAAARALAGAQDHDADLAVAAQAPLQGGSAGLPVGLLALAALLGEALPPHLATGAVVDHAGFLAGGAAARPKAAAAAAFAPQLGMPDPLFLVPPVRAPPEVPGLRVATACDLGSAWARLAPPSYARIAAAHRALRAVPGAPPGPFAVVHRPPGGPPLPAMAGGLALREAPGPALPAGAWVTVGDGGLALWRTYLPTLQALDASLPELLALARAGAAP